jgi:hypothetical protein
VLALAGVGDAVPSSADEGGVADDNVSEAAFGAALPGLATTTPMVTPTSNTTAKAATAYATNSRGLALAIAAEMLLLAVGFDRTTARACFAAARSRS